MSNHRDTGLVGPDGLPLHAKKPEDSLPYEIQALVDVRVNSAMDAARDVLRQEAATARHDSVVRGWIKFGASAIAAATLGVLLWIFGPSEVKKWTKDFVAENMNKPSLEAAAKEVVTNRMGTFVAEQVRPLSQDIAGTRTAISEANLTLERLQEEQRLFGLLNRAEVFDKEALKELKLVAEGTNEVAQLANAMVSKVRRTLMFEKGNLSFLIPKKSYAGSEYEGPFTSDELADFLRDGKSSVLEGAVNKTTDPNRPLFMPRLVEIAHESKDLLLINRACLAIEKMTGAKIDPLDLKTLDNWWAKHRNNYTNWPLQDYDAAWNYFMACNYSEALKAYEKVLSIDPTADKSRALAVGCALEVGDTNMVAKLNNGYEQKDGRWAKWAQNKALLSSGQRDQATTNFATLVKDYPTMQLDGCIVEGNHILRDIKWPIFASLSTASTNNSK